MKLRSWLESYANAQGVPIRLWGRTGADVRASLERELGIQFGQEIGEFVDTIGNVNVGPFMVAVAGDEQGRLSAASETKLMRYQTKQLPIHYVKIMEHAGESYFYDSKTDRVCAIDSFSMFPLMTTLSFNTFLDFLTWISNEAKSQSEDVRSSFPTTRGI